MKKLSLTLIVVLALSNFLAWSFLLHAYVYDIEMRDLWHEYCELSNEDMDFVEWMELEEDSIDKFNDWMGDQCASCFDPAFDE